MANTSPIAINASNLAALIGKHPFTKRVDAFLAAWKSSDRASYLAAHQRNNRLTIEQERRRIHNASMFLQDNPATETLLKSIGSPTTAHTFSSMSAGIDASKIAEETRRLAYTRHGEEKEMAIIDRVNDVWPDYGFAAYEPMLRKPIGETRRGRPIVLQGRIDGLSSDGRVILECKTRVHKLFMKIREYEAIQIESYLELLPGAKRAVLAEGVFNVGPIPSINLISVERTSTENNPDNNQDNSQDWLSMAVAMGNVLDQVMSDVNLQDSLICSKDDKLIKRLLLTDPNHDV